MALRKQPDHEVIPHLTLRAPTFEFEKAQKSGYRENTVELDLPHDEKDATAERGSGPSRTPSPKISSRRSSSISSYVIDDEGLPIIENGDLEPASLLRTYGIKLLDRQTDKFWTLKLLRHILTRDRIKTKVKKDIAAKRLVLGELSLNDLIEAIHPEKEPHPYSEEDNSHYIRIYALLLLTDKSHEIVRFVQNKQSDGALPFRFKQRDNDIDVIRSKRTQSTEKIRQCFKNFKDLEKDFMGQKQTLLLTPYFDLDEDNEAKHTDFPDYTILPWCKRDEPVDEDSDDDDEEESETRTATEPSGREGAYGLVCKVKLHPTSHGFRKVLEAIQLNDELFALKKLDSIAHSKDPQGMQKAFEREVHNLRRFSGLHEYCDHLVSLLATFTLNNQYYFLFPWAEYSLEEYWEDAENYAIVEEKGGVDLDTVQWVAKQIAGLTVAIDTIHEPPPEKQKKTKNKYLDPNFQDGKPRYGRHGDIKPDNILWFKSGKDPRGILVVSDMGLTSVNRDTSRSNIPGRQIAGGAGYRPPECEVLGGTVNRSFDIWTLGCLYLELITWLLGGCDLVEVFNEKRTTYYIITRTKKDLFFDLKQYRQRDGSTGTVAVVKDEVKECIRELHAHPNCTQFAHDLLDKVEKEMLIILSQDKKRSMSGTLRADFQRMYDKCIKDISYATKRVPEKRKRSEPVAVEAELAPTMQDELKLSQTLGKTLETYTGRRQKSMTKEDLERMDELRESLL
ncbi:Protein kinase-like domain containing protein [Naviculisporaceae sp. PSN 640]